MYNYYREDWLIQRLAGTVQKAFGHAPCVDLVGGGQAVVAAAVTEADQSCGAPAVLPADVVAPATDDHPFLYFRGESIPSIYLWVLGSILLVSLIAIRKVGGPIRRMRPTSISSSWAPRSSCSRQRASRPLPCSSGPRGSSTPWCSPESWSSCFSPSR